MQRGEQNSTRRVACGPTAPRRHGGYTYVMVLLMVAIIGVGLTAVAEVWSTTAERQKKAQLEWVGRQYVKAIESYYYANVGSVHYYPPTLEALLEDKRYLYQKRHLREMYPNPISGQMDWVLLPAPGGGIAGLAESISTEATSPRQFVFAPNRVSNR